MSAAPTGSTPPIPAGTVVPLRDGPGGLEVLLLRRNSHGPFGGMWVFPGGQVDPEDRPLFSKDGEGDPGDPTAELEAARTAAVREAHEEAALDLVRADLEVLSFWLPPPGTPTRFATWFFLAPVVGHPEVLVDGVEIHEHRWLTPVESMNLRQEGQIQLVPPTFMTLAGLAGQPDVATALRAAAQARPERFESRMASAGGVPVCMWAGDAGYEDGAAERPGPRRRLVLDPAGWRVELTR